MWDRKHLIDGQMSNLDKVILPLIFELESFKPFIPIMRATVYIKEYKHESHLFLNFPGNCFFCVSEKYFLTTTLYKLSSSLKIIYYYLASYFSQRIIENGSWKEYYDYLVQILSFLMYFLLLRSRSPDKSISFYKVRHKFDRLGLELQFPHSKSSGISHLLT